MEERKREKVRLNRYGMNTNFIFAVKYLTSFLKSAIYH